MRYKSFLMLGLFFIGSILQSQTSYSNENENTKILKEILKEIEQLKKGQDKMSKELAALKTAQPSQNKAAGGAKPRRLHRSRRSAYELCRRSTNRSRCPL